MLSNSSSFEWILKISYMADIHSAMYTLVNVDFFALFHSLMNKGYIEEHSYKNSHRSDGKWNFGGLVSVVKLFNVCPSKLPLASISWSCITKTIRMCTKAECMQQNYNFKIVSENIVVVLRSKLKEKNTSELINCSLVCWATLHLSNEY